MAQTRTSGSVRRVGEEWQCTLSLSPQRVLTADWVTMNVALSSPDGNEPDASNEGIIYNYTADDPRLSAAVSTFRTNNVRFQVPALPDGDYEITVRATGQPPAGFPPFPPDGVAGEATLSSVAHQIFTRSAVTLQRTASFPTDDQALWVAIRNRTAALDFTRYQRFIDNLFCGNDFDISAAAQSMRGPMSALLDNSMNNRPLSIFGPYAYSVLKLATQVFLTLECGVVIREDKKDGHTIFSADRLFDLEKEKIRLDDPSASLITLNERLKDYLLQYDNNATVLPYLGRIVTALVGLDRDDVREVLPYCYGILQHRLTAPSLLELIWSYWHEEGMLVQTMNMIALRFQNRRGSRNDPLVELELDPLRPLNNLIWGFIQDEHNRLTVPRRAAEYHHHYGLSLVGRATASVVPADNRSKFIEAFHNLLHRAAMFYKEDADTTVIAEAFPLLNALKEVHLILAEGAHNQFGDLPWTARGEMLITQWMLARPETREFLRGRYMVPYQEGWMGAVDCMKRLQGWTDTTVTHFHELAVTGERILLSIRYGDWVDIENIQEQAKNWARYWKPEIQRYIHAYQAVTGVDLMADLVDSRDAAIRLVQPSTLLQRRLRQQKSPAALPDRRPELSLPSPAPIGAVPAGSPGGGPGYAELPMASQRRLPRFRPFKGDETR